MINIDEFMLTPQEILLNIAKNEKRKRKIKGFTQAKLAEMSGVTLGSIRRFEQTGDISLVHMLKIAIVLDEVDSLSALFSKAPEYRTMKELLEAQERIRKFHL